MGGESGRGGEPSYLGHAHQRRGELNNTLGTGQNTGFIFTDNGTVHRIDELQARGFNLEAFGVTTGPGTNTVASAGLRNLIENGGPPAAAGHQRARVASAFMSSHMGHSLGG